MPWATGHGRRRQDHAPHPTRRLVVAVGLALGTAVGAAAVDSAVKTHSGAESANVIAATAAYSVHPAPSVPTTVRASTTTSAPPTTVARPTPPAPPVTTPHPAAHAPSAPPVSHPATGGLPVTAQQAVTNALQTRSTTPAAPALAGPDTCSAALSYLSAHSAPGFRFECPGYALGHQAMTCINVAGVCPGAKLIVISVVCPASYMNEAHNSWVVSGLQSGSIDPYGYCH